VRNHPNLTYQKNWRPEAIVLRVTSVAHTAEPNSTVGAQLSRIGALLGADAEVISAAQTLRRQLSRKYPFADI
jgi:hypothetical protein